MMTRQAILTEWVDLLNQMDKLVAILEPMDETNKDFIYLKQNAYNINDRIAAFEDTYPWLAKVSVIIDEE